MRGSIFSSTGSTGSQEQGHCNASVDPSSQGSVLTTNVRLGVLVKGLDDDNDTRVSKREHSYTYLHYIVSNESTLGIF